MQPLETYLQDLSDIHSSGAGVKEASYYPALATLLDAVGKTLKPKVKCIINLRNSGAGIPDGGLFSAEQLKGLDDGADPLVGQLPARAVLEVKGASAELEAIVDSLQVAKYLNQYGLVLVTNCRAFRLVRAGPGGKLERLEAYRLAETAKDFWALAAHPHTAAAEQGERLADYLRRVMLTRSPLTTPKDVAWFLASYAREARARIEAGDLLTLAAIRATLEQTLGLTFEGEKGDHFFRSTLVQTLFYGIFSAWVLWHGEDPARSDPFDWRTAPYYLRVPVIQALFDEVADANKLRALDLMEVLNWAGETLNRVIRPAFFASFEHGYAVQYFYEPFLEAFDPELRKDLGVWYTPPEIVKYMVARVDTVLRQELNIPDGLADPRVVVLDPCAGTGAYLVEVLNTIAATLRDNGEGALLAGEVKRAALERVFGFEILPAPYVVAHLQLGLLLRNLGAPLAEGERAGMFLTNSLTGWEPPKEPKTRLPLFQELAAERDAAEKVKREAKVLVVLGNPPYNAFAGVAVGEEQDLIEPYKRGLKDWGITKNYLDDLYVRFFRLAERRIAEQTGRGVVCFVSNFSYLSDTSFVVMRQRFLGAFDSLWFDCLNGDSRETGKLTPEGKPDPSVFSTESNREGIRVGTAIGLMVRKEQRANQPVPRFRQFWGVNKRAELLASASTKGLASHYELVGPEAANHFTFRPSSVSLAYRGWPSVEDFSSIKPMLGLNENRGGALQDIDRSKLKERMVKYFDSSISWDEFSDGQEEGLTRKAAGFDPKAVRIKALKEETFSDSRIVRYVRRPFDIGYAYISDVSPLWNRSRPELRRHLAHAQYSLITRPAGAASPEGVPVFMTRLLGEQDSIRGHAYFFPFEIIDRPVKQSASQIDFLTGTEKKSNLSALARAYLTSLGVVSPEADPDIAELLWMHALAIGYSPAYLQENADGVQEDWLRVPLPKSKTALLKSASLGKQVAALLNTESPVAGVTIGAIRPEFKTVGVVLGSMPLNLSVTTGWGHVGKDGVTMPGKGKRVERQPAPGEQVAGLGDVTHDVYLNDDTYWRNIPARVWDYTIGGYQVIKKWLSYREAKLLGRSITQDEAREVSHMARRIGAILLLEPELDVNYEAVKGATYAWPPVG